MTGDCAAKRYAPGPCDSPVAFLVQYRSATTRQVTEEHPACFRHALAEVDRHHASAGIAHCEFVPMPRGWQPATPTTPGGAA